MQSSQNGSDRIAALRKREQALKSAIAQELVRQQRRKEKEDARLCSIIGAALMDAAKHPDFELLLKNVLQKATSLSDGERKLLRAKGWL